MRSVLSLGVACAVAMLAVAPAVAPAMPAPDPATTIGERLDLVGFVDERGTPFETLHAAVERTGRRPWIVSPIYTRCRATCSPLTAALKRALAAVDPAAYAVVSFSFDPEERPELLAAFRVRLALPPEWLTLRATDAAALGVALATLDFRTVALADGQLDHPNLVAILTPDLRVSEYLLGLDVTGARLAAALERARAGGAGPRAWRAPLFVVAALGFAASAFVFVSRLLRLRALR